MRALKPYQAALVGEAPALDVAEVEHRRRVAAGICVDCGVVPPAIGCDACSECQTEADDFEWNVKTCADEHSAINCYCPPTVVAEARTRIQVGS
jgi:hypothetical protein